MIDTDDPVRPLGKLLLDIVVRARRVGDVESTLLVERGGDRPVNQRRSGHWLDREPRGHLEGAIPQLELPGAAWHETGPDQGQRESSQSDPHKLNVQY